MAKPKKITVKSCQFKDAKFLSNFGINRRKEKEEYKNLDITDADYEDIDKENKS